MALSLIQNTSVYLFSYHTYLLKIYDVLTTIHETLVILKYMYIIIYRGNTFFVFEINTKM
jgi:hypothetical protein